MSVTWTKESLAAFKTSIEGLNEDYLLILVKEEIIGIIDHAIARENDLEIIGKAIFDDSPPVRIHHPNHPVK